MIEEPATVITCDADFAIVETQVKPACGSCHAETTCSTSVLSGLFKRRHNRVKVLNPIQAKPGQRVIIGLQERTLLTVSLLAYFFPLLCMICLAILAEAGARYWEWSHGELISIAGGLSGLFIGIALLKYFTDRKNDDPDYQAVILRQESAKSVQFM